MDRSLGFVPVSPSTGRLRLPQEARTLFGLGRPGMQVEVIARDGELVLVPYVAVRAAGAVDDASFDPRAARWAVPEPTQHIAYLLRTGLAAGKARIVGRDGDAALPGGQWGHAGQHIGWSDTKTLWLTPSTTARIITEQGVAQGQPLGLRTVMAMSKALAEAGVLTVTEDRNQRHRHARRRIGGALRCVWEIPVSWLFPDDQG